MRQVAHKGYTDIRHQRTQFSRLHDLTQGVFAHLNINVIVMARINMLEEPTCIICNIGTRWREDIKFTRSTLI
jgi:hypothetical protein